MLGNRRATAITAFKNQASVSQVRCDSTWSSLGRGPGIPQKATTPSPNTTAFSVLPTKLLLRSLLVTTVSSNWLLRVPSLSILFLLTKAKGALLNADKNPLIHGVLKKTLYDHFCAGEKESQVRDTIQQIKDTGLRGVILTHARETVYDVHSKPKKEKALEANAESHCEAIQAWTEGVLQTVDMLSEGDYLALKPTGSGPRVTQAFSSNQPIPLQMVEAMDEICRRVVQRKVRILMDAEQHDFLGGIHEMTLDLMRKYNRNGVAVVYNTYQAYLKTTPETIAAHMHLASTEGFALGLKLVRGAYMRSDPRGLIHDTKEETDRAYNSIVQGVLKRQYKDFGGEQGTREFPPTDLFLATHNKESAVAAHNLHQSRVNAKIPTVNVEYGQLMGMADSVSFGLLQLKDQNNVSPAVYKCLHWGTMGECMGFLVRRARENQDAVSRTETEHRILKAEVKRRLKLSA